MKNQRHMVAAIEGEYRRYKSLAEGTFSQLQERDLVEKSTPESLSVTQIVWHVSGNLESRFTDFLSTDGEKPWRDRESEFAERRVSRKEMLAKWERGWAVLFGALAPLSDRDLNAKVTIRAIGMTVGEALERSLAHTSYHVGQITFLGKMLRRSEWKYLSIPPGQTTAYNANPTRERAQAPAGTGAKGASRKPAAKKGPRKTPAKARTPAGARPKKTASKAPKKKTKGRR